MCMTGKPSVLSVPSIMERNVRKIQYSPNGKIAAGYQLRWNINYQGYGYRQSQAKNQTGKWCVLLPRHGNS